MMVWKMFFLFNWVIFRFQPLIFRGVYVVYANSSGVGELFMLLCGDQWEHPSQHSDSDRELVAI